MKRNEPTMRNELANPLSNLLTPMSPSAFTSGNSEPTVAVDVYFNSWERQLNLLFETLTKMLIDWLNGSEKNLIKCVTRRTFVFRFHQPFSIKIRRRCWRRVRMKKGAWLSEGWMKIHFNFPPYQVKGRSEDSRDKTDHSDEVERNEKRWKLKTHENLFRKFGSNFPYLLTKTNSFQLRISFSQIALPAYCTCRENLWGDWNLKTPLT